VTPELVEIGERLRQLRQSRGVSQSELARRTAAARTYIVAVEQGQHEPSLDLLRRFSAALSYPLPELVRALVGQPFSDPAAPLAERVRLRRERLALSASQLALRAQTTRATIFQIEAGLNANPGLALLSRLARALGCCPSELTPP
jgi:transcriptional regulator with XRE-family HTH domain